MTHSMPAVLGRALKNRFHCIPGCIVLSLFAALVFSVYPQVDVWVSHVFYANDGIFPANEMWLVKVFYLGTPWAGRVLFVGSIFLLTVAVLMPSRVSRRNWRRASAFVAVVVLGIGLLVHTVLKDGMGRPRPRDVQAFAGPAAFVPVFVPSQFCQTNCSFVSGHAAVGFALMSLGMFGIRRKRQFWLVTGLFVGGLIGLTRVAQGGHFLSDIVFSLIAIWFSHLLIRTVWLRFRAWQFHKRSSLISHMQKSL
jgi:lipid A 4'-phosphatase